MKSTGSQSLSIARLPAVIVFLLATTIAAAAEHTSLSLGSLFRDHMVLQRDRPVVVWGRAQAGTTVQVRLAEPLELTTSTSTKVEHSGRWRTELPPMHAGGPLKMFVSTSAEPGIVLSDILVGDVWLCSGQSNMGFTLSSAKNGKRDVDASSNSMIRLFKVGLNPSPAPIEFLSDSPEWKLCGPSSAGSFSAVGYYFGRDLQTHLGVPIGLIQSAVGGTSAECWVSREGLKQFPVFDAAVEKLDLEKRDPNYAKQKFRRDFLKWYEKVIKDDTGSKPTSSQNTPAWATPNIDETEWTTASANSEYEPADLKNFSGTIWLRGHVQSSADASTTNCFVSFPKSADCLSVWLDGQLIQETTFTESTAHEHHVTPEQLSSGLNTLSIRIIHKPGTPVLEYPNRLMLYRLGSDGGRIPHPVQWKYRKGAKVSGRFPVEAGPPRRPTVLFNAMIAPLIPFSLKGFVWYQGESNVTRAEQYRRLFPALISDWRKQWNDINLPFLFVQLPRFHNRKDAPADDTWTELREAQLMTARNVPNTGMACIIDTGEAKNIHPGEKEPAGQRLALAARAVAYGEQVEWSGPVMKSSSIEGNEVHIAFDHVGSGLTTTGDSPSVRGFAIAGEDHKFVWAGAQIIYRDTVAVKDDRVTRPLAVRYAWSGNPDCNLADSQKQPASSFRTDNWPGLSDGNTTDSVIVE